MRWTSHQRKDSVMKHIDFEFNGRTYALSYTAEALFLTFDKFGVCDDVIEATHCLEPTAEGWRNCCWLAALMASQGELQRRALGYDKQPMLTAEELRVGVMAVDNARLRMAVRRALEQAFHRDVPDPDTEKAPSSIPGDVRSTPGPPACRRPPPLPRNRLRHDLRRPSPGGSRGGFPGRARAGSERGARRLNSPGGETPWPSVRSARPSP